MNITIRSRFNSVGNAEEFYAVYRCSHCLNPIIKHFTISADEEHYVDYAQKDMQNAVIERVVKHKDRLLEYLSKPTAKLFGEIAGPDRDRRYKLSGFASACCLCGRSEPWQDNESLNLCELSSPISYFETINKAFEYAKEFLWKRLAAAQETQFDPANKSKALHEMEQIRDQIRALEDEKINGDAATCVRELQQRKTELINRRNSLGPFSKEKKSLTAEIQACEAEQPQADRRYKEALQRLELEIAKAKQMIDEKQYLLKQYTGKAFFIEAGDNLSMALCEIGVPVEAGELISLSSLPELFDGGCVSAFEYENAESIQLLINELGLGEGEKANG